MPNPWDYAAKTRTEQAEQTALFMWVAMAERFGHLIADDPLSYTQAGFAKTQFDNAGKLGYKKICQPITQLKWLHAINNNAGKGDAIRGAMAKAQGVKAGIPDIFLPVPIHVSATQAMSGYPKFLGFGGIWCGYYIELKRLKSERGKAGVTAEVQTECHKDLIAAGYKVDIFYGWELAKAGLLSYLGVTT